MPRSQTRPHRFRRSKLEHHDDEHNRPRPIWTPTLNRHLSHGIRVAMTCPQQCRSPTVVSQQWSSSKKNVNANRTTSNSFRPSLTRSSFSPRRPMRNVTTTLSINCRKKDISTSRSARRRIRKSTGDSHRIAQTNHTNHQLISFTIIKRPPTSARLTYIIYRISTVRPPWPLRWILLTKDLLPIPRPQWSFERRAKTSSSNSRWTFNYFVLPPLLRRVRLSFARFVDRHLLHLIDRSSSIRNWKTRVTFNYRKLLHPSCIVNAHHRALLVPRLLIRRLSIVKYRPLLHLPRWSWSVFDRMSQRWYRNRLRS